MEPSEKTQFVREIRCCAGALKQQGAVAVGSLYDLTAPRLIRYARIWTGSQDDAEDALQAAMLAFVRKPQLLAEARHPWAYCLGVTRHESLRIVRRNRAMRPWGQELDAASAPEERSLEFADLAVHVRRALAKLPRSQAEVVVLKIWEEMTFSEIAEVLDQSPNTVASRYRYGLGKLADHLQAFNEEMLYE